MIDFTIILPTRERKALLKTLLDTLLTNTKHKKKIEVLMVYDDNDEVTKEFVNEFTNKYKSINVKFYEVEQSNNFSKDYYNYLAYKANGNFIIAVNDDAEFLTKDWDEIAKEKLEEYLKDKPDRIVYGWFDDEVNNEGFCCFPLLSKETVVALGWFFRPVHCSWNADTDLITAFRNNLAYRILDLKEIKLGHNTYHTGRRAKDSVNMRSSFCHNYATEYEERITPGQKIINYIRGYSART